MVLSNGGVSQKNNQANAKCFESTLLAPVNDCLMRLRQTVLRNGGHLNNRDIHAEKNTWPWYKVGRKMCSSVYGPCYTDKML